MLEVLQFVFSSFWIWLGTVIIFGEIAAIRLVSIRIKQDFSNDNSAYFESDEE